MNMIKIFNDKKFLVISLQKIIQSFYGLILIILIINFFDLSQQGIYYLMSSIIASHVVFDLGLSTFLVQKTSTYLLNDENKFLDYKFFILKFYTIVALSILILIPIGLLYFNLKINFSLFFEWIVICLILSISQPFFAYLNVIESRDIIWVYSLRIINYLLGAIFSIFFFVAGQGYFSLISLFISTTLTTLFYIIIKDGKYFFKTNFKKNVFSIKKNIFDNQWRVFLYFCSYYIFFNFPILSSFYFFNEKVSGQLALTLIISNVIFAIAFSKITSVVPIITKKIFIQSDNEGKNIFFQKLKESVALSFIFSLFFYIIVFVLKKFFDFDRILNFPSNLIILANTFMLYLINTFVIFFRSLNIEIFYREFSLMSFLYLIIIICLKNILNLYILIILSFILILISLVILIFKFYGKISNFNYLN